jgi:putative colanic acid biosynthesis acetyltransferase WcaF
VSSKPKLYTYNQESAYATPWSIKERLGMFLWGLVWALLCSWTPKPFNQWRLFCLRIFGAQIIGHPFVHQNAHIQIPWNLIMHDRACLGDGAYAYSLGQIELMDDAIVAQQAYLCTGTHKFEDPNRPLQTGKITVGKSAFIGARAFIMPGITVGNGAIVAACSVVTRNVDDYKVVAGNPAKSL